MTLSDETPHLHQPLGPPPESVSVFGSSDGLYLLMEIDSGSSGSPTPPFPLRTPVLSAWPHHFSPWLNVLVLSSEAVGWVVTCLLTPPFSSLLLFLPEKTSAPLQTPVLTARRGEMESSHPPPQAVLYSNILLVKSPLQTVVLLCCSQRLT